MRKNEGEEVVGGTWIIHCSRSMKAPGRVDQAAGYNERAPILNASTPVLCHL